MKPRTVGKMNEVWEKLMKFASRDQEDRERISEAFNDMLDSLLDEDFFGTEGQCDPRGDHRNGR